MKIRTVVTAALSAYIASVSLVWVVASRGAQHKTEVLLQYGASDLEDSVYDKIDSTLGVVAYLIVRHLESPTPLTHDETVALARDYGVDELNVVRRDGRIVASSDDRFRGKNMCAWPQSNEFMCLTNEVISRFTQPFRNCAYVSNVKRKYVGVPFPKADGFVQVGYDYSALKRDVEFILGDMFDKWSLGEEGYYLGFDPQTWNLCGVPNRYKGFVGCPPESIGLDMNTVRAAHNGEVIELSIGGSRVFCRKIEFAGRVFLAVVPYGEFFADRNLVVGVCSFVFLFVILAFVAVVARMVRDSAHISALHEEEERHRATDMTLAESIQRNSLPRVFPPYPDMSSRFDIHATMRPAREVGGDFYDFYRLGASRLAVVIADVAGKGVPSAMFMMKTQSALKALLVGGRSLASVTTEVNSILNAGNEDYVFVTAWVGVIDLCTGSVEYVNAGHNPPLVCRSSGAIEVLSEENPNLPFAVIEDAEYSTGNILLSPGDLLLLYTDGVTEAMNRHGVLFDEKRLIDAVSTPCDTAESLCRTVLNAVDGFVAGAEQSDDITMLAYRFKMAERTFPATNEGLANCAEFTSAVLPGADSAVVFDELVSNIVRCSGANRIIVRIGPNKEVEISDDGSPFDPTALPDPDVTAPLENRKVGGLGVFIVRHLTEDFRYAREDGMNVVRFKMKD